MQKPDFTSVDSCLLDTESNLLERLRRQLQYYLADANLTNDFYLRERLAESKGGFLSIDLFLAFNRVKELLESVQNLQDQRQMIRSCVKSSRLLKLNRSGLKLKRVKSFKSEDQQEVKCKTLYLEGFGKQLDRLTFLKFLNRFGKIVRLYVPSFAKGDNKGFAFATFADLQACEQAYGQLRGLVCQQLFSEWQKKRSMRVLRRREWQQQKLQFKRLLREGQEFPGCG